MLALLWCLVRGLLLAGRMLREYSARAAARDGLADFTRALERDLPALPDLPKQGLVAEALAGLLDVAENEVLAGRIVDDCQLAWQADLERLRSLARLGPALGLMGTLIPLGPALVGLAAGDLQMMSQNLVIAFATTVVGLLVGTLATTLAGIKKCWYQTDAALVMFAADRLPQLCPGEDRGEQISQVAPQALAGGNGSASHCDGAHCACVKEPSHV